MQSSRFSQARIIAVDRDPFKFGLAKAFGATDVVDASEGDTVTPGQVVVKLEAMKMENDITALVGGTVKQVAVAEGAEVSDGQLLVLVE